MLAAAFAIILLYVYMVPYLIANISNEILWVFCFIQYYATFIVCVCVWIVCVSMHMYCVYLYILSVHMYCVYLCIFV